MEFEIAVDAHAFIGEGPVWDHRQDTLWWLDIFRHELHAFDPKTGADKTTDLGAQIGAVALRASGGLVLAAPEGFVAFDPETGARSLLATVDHDPSAMRLNDGKCDSRGRFWAGSIAHNAVDPEAVTPVPGAAKLYRLAPGTDAVAVLDGVTVSNGMGWSPSDDTFYYVDTLTLGVDAFDYDADSGVISNRRTLLTLSPTEGHPDGMCVDEDGCIWLALSGAGQIRRVTPKGDVDRTLHVPLSRVTSCAFGGPELDELYITTHSALMSHLDRQAESKSGALLRCRPGVRGLPSNAFAG
ncbi:MAG: SMP-30/gluconolactonase/LRE family protein [Acidimicrobiales bacterium]